MSLSDRIGKYRQRASIVLAGPRLRGRTPQPPPAPFVCGVTRSGTTLLRLMLDSHPELAIPGETHWVPKLIKSFERSKQSPEDTADLVIDHKRWGDFHLDADEMRQSDPRDRAADRSGRDPQLLSDLRRARGQGPLRRQDPRLRARDAPDPAGAAGGALRPHHPRRPRRLALAHADELGAGDLRAIRAPVAQPDPQGAQDGPRRRALHGGSLRGARRRHRGRAAPRVRVRRARLRPGDARLSRARRRPPGGEGPRAAAQEPPQPDGGGADGQPPAGEGAAALGPGRDVARADDAGGGRRVRGGRRRHAGQLGYELASEAGAERAREKRAAAPV